jgi:hypothetical protein
MSIGSARASLNRLCLFSGQGAYSWEPPFVNRSACEGLDMKMLKKGGHSWIAEP